MKENKCLLSKSSVFTMKASEFSVQLGTRCIAHSKDCTKMNPMHFLDWLNCTSFLGTAALHLQVMKNNPSKVCLEISFPCNWML